MSFWGSDCGKIAFGGSDYGGYGEWMIFVLDMVGRILGMVCVSCQWQRQGDGGLLMIWVVWWISSMGFVCHGGGLMVASWMTWVVWWVWCATWWVGLDDCRNILFFLGCDFGFTGDASKAPTAQNFALLWFGWICSNVVGLCSDPVDNEIGKFLQNDFLNIVTYTTKHCKMKIFYRKYFQCNIFYIWKYFTSKQTERQWQWWSHLRIEGGLGPF